MALIRTNTKHSDIPSGMTGKFYVPQTGLSFRAIVVTAGSAATIANLESAAIKVYDAASAGNLITSISGNSSYNLPSGYNAVYVTTDSASSSSGSITF